MKCSTSLSCVHCTINVHPTLGVLTLRLKEMLGVHSVTSQMVIKFDDHVTSQWSLDKITAQECFLAFNISNISIYFFILHFTCIFISLQSHTKRSDAC